MAGWLNKKQRWNEILYFSQNLYFINQLQKSIISIFTGIILSSGMLITPTSPFSPQQGPSLQELEHRTAHNGCPTNRQTRHNKVVPGWKVEPRSDFRGVFRLVGNAPVRERKLCVRAVFLLVLHVWMGVPVVGVVALAHRPVLLPLAAPTPVLRRTEYRLVTYYQIVTETNNCATYLYILFYRNLQYIVLSNDWKSLQAF